MTDLLHTIPNSGPFTKFMEALETTELTEMLKGPGPFTVLAPTDEAFDSLPSETLNELKADSHKLKQVLLHHVLSGDVRSDDLAEIEEAPTVEGSILTVKHGDSIMLNEANVTQVDILADNGVVHVVDSVMLPVIYV